jgi:hypothetical protein
MIRAAKMMDVFRLVELVEYGQRHSGYVGEVDVDPVYARKLLATLIMRHGGTHEHGTFCMVAEDSDGIVQAFMAGMLERVHLVGNKLQATDVFLVATKTAPKRALFELFGAFVAWGLAIDKVYKVVVSRTDVMDPDNRLTGFYKSRGLEPAGGIFVLKKKTIELEEAA